MGFAFQSKCRLTVFYNIRKELKIDIKVSEKGAVDSDYSLVHVPADKTIAVFFISCLMRTLLFACHQFRRIEILTLITVSISD